ncbi:metallophosphoesterase [Chitinophaga sp. 212800010-3]|uniref:metallophosphoesterase family protein n=1 Tax=unclassified Chitinophaga TaxID=2619133 RepID=UPI002DF2D841|nr:Metallophos domain-containing protein [Chitinophaga sp. 212800010-3]
MILIGDLHGGYPEILSRIRKFKMASTALIQVGDWGLGFQPVDDDLRVLRQTDDFLGSQHNMLYIIRGNHDNKWFWDNRDDFHLQNIRLVKDYEYLTIEDSKILFAGGGISIDRINRTQGKDYWPDEEIVWDAAALKGACEAGIDIMVSHIAPREAWPYTYDPLVQHFASRELAAGRNLTAALEDERKVMSEIFRDIKEAGCHTWYYGHYHASQVEEKEGITFRCLGIGEMYDAGNVKI